ncbi:MAG: hypothetical protein COV52_03315 [Gammaproteobacteria bacterium CG11_big_fil_rev_8_21_14_0_20_46_22]|nr:MAG: hypothetical protein COW05_00785 [Gammaproteobacteria bacterium CG12_big_fil_rev_8_21_14_0_65_46_12]PIR11571.1 MAG: hypothetical protein COV52_03315 [Gammaproteobacteria bacterium CG11_big_fil_rev_8_21_14_0_20_46_22]
MEKFVVMVAGICQAGMEDYVKEHMKAIVKHSRQNPGCQIYNVHQSTANPREFMMYSAWNSQDDFDKHNKTPEIDELKHKLAKVFFINESPKTYWRTLD